MARGQTYGKEVIQFTDKYTGAEIIQVTRDPCISGVMYFENCHFTPDGKTVLYQSRRSASRDAPEDLYACDLHSGRSTQLTEVDDFRRAALSLDGTQAFYLTTRELRVVDIGTCEDRPLHRFDDAEVVNGPALGGQYIFWRVEYAGRDTEIMRCNTDGSDVRTLGSAPRITHMTASRTGRWIGWITFSERTRGDEVFNVARSDGSDAHRWAEQRWAHASWVGEMDRMQGTLLPPGHGITWCSPEDATPQTICEGPYFWHSSASLDAEWIVSDTNWPDIGLQLVHVPSGRFGTLCVPMSSNSNPAHPHPSFNQDGTKVMYTSDASGIPQVYIVTVPEWLRDELRTGKLLARRRVARV